MLDSSPPAVSTDAHDHAGRGPNRNDAARAATPTAPTASPSTEPAGPTGPRFGSSTWAHITKWADARAATAAKRRNQPRTVDAGRPTVSAAWRCPEP